MLLLNVILQTNPTTSMDWSEFWLLITGGLSPAFILAFLIFANLGMGFTMLVHYKKHKRKAKKNSKKVKFSSKYWWKDNLNRLLLVELVVLIIMRFFEKLPISSDLELGMLAAFVVGASIDLAIIALRNFTKVGAFQTSEAEPAG